MRLCINCDDFGLSPQIDKGTLEAAEAGLISSCSVLPYSASHDNLNRLGIYDAMSVGLHFSLTTLEQGIFASASSPGRLLKEILSRRIKASHIREELERQYDVLRSKWKGEVTHIDTHQHVHIIPMINDVLHKFASAHSIPHVRNPKETTYRQTRVKIIINLGFGFQKQDIPFWGQSFMGKNFTKDNICKQFDYLASQGIEDSIWMVHVGYSDRTGFKDPYNKEREQELRVLLGLSDEIKSRFKIVSLTELE
ncbi:MAG TPA: ChbG/HpnK family deacetylase [Nitrospirae bacterium]|nr:ChbG/HpnK family deacetylase [Nitrospirota bacterium]